MATVLYRKLYIGSRGKDVEAAKRCVYKLLARGGHGEYWEYFKKQDTKQRRTFGATFAKHLLKAQGQLGIRKIYRGRFNQKTLNALYKVDAVDAVSEQLFEKPEPPWQDVVWAKMLESAKAMSSHTPGYQLGGGHGQPLRNVSPFQKLDCSSSTSKMLYDGGIFDSEYAKVSGMLAHWGAPGKGKYFTIYANSEHVFTRFRKTRWWRFDTSPQGDGGRGPQLRMLPRFTSGFTARHYPGM